MRQDLAFEIQGQLVRYLAGEMPLQEFRKWFDAETWDIRKAGDPEAYDLANEVELRLAEFSNGDWTEEELRERLTPLVRVYSRHEQFWGNSGFRYRTSSESSVVPAPVTVFETGRLAPPAGKVSAWESA